MNRILLAIALSASSMLAQAHPKPNDNVVLKTSSGCGACVEAKQLLNAAHVRYAEQQATGGGYVPQLYVNGKFKGYGVDTVERYLQ